MVPILLIYKVYSINRGNNTFLCSMAVQGLDLLKASGFAALPTTRKSEMWCESSASMILLLSGF